MRQRLRTYAPEATDAAIEAAIEASPDTRAVRERAAAPTLDQLQPWLSAWLGDMSVHELFVRWERDHADRLLASDPDEEPATFEAAWHRMHGLLYAPSYARVLLLLRPVHDPERDRIGFWRLVLPRTTWMGERLKDWKRDEELADLPMDLVPDAPFGYRVVRSRLSGSRSPSRATASGSCSTGPASPSIRSRS